MRFAFNPEARVVVGADVGATHGRIALTDLTGRPLCEIGEDLEITDGPEIVLDWVTSTTSRMLEVTGRGVEDLIGVGIGLPGPVEHSSGRPMRPPIMPGWDNYDVPAHVGRVFDVPVATLTKRRCSTSGWATACSPSAMMLTSLSTSTGTSKTRPTWAGTS